MTSIAELLPRAGKLKYEIRQQLRRVELGQGDASDCSIGIAELDRQLQTLTALLDSERPDKRALWRLKIDELRHEANFLASDFRKMQRARDTAWQRERLFHRRSVASSSAVDDLNAEADSLAASSTQVDELMENGRANLSSLAMQRERLKATHRNALSMINTLGLSNSLMRMVHSRQKNDRYIVFGGMALCLLVLWACVKWRSAHSS
ncbi:hypothetical protein CTAYLR_010307 [Chrysophaeum taylorii]|uniref:Membrin n=1 Tax=Chrysophaeum taylorii TaxID=2483200 RepID=A0AAD7UKI3_9STRA|nr:hypothetical protein CTAYLR_010307 [Chrysophaeum taylorii]